MSFPKGGKQSNITKEKIRNTLKQRYNNDEEKRKLSLRFGTGTKGYKYSKESREKQRQAKKDKYLGENNPNWRGGISDNPYPQDWTEYLREGIRQRDGYICQICGIHESELKCKIKKLHVHHIESRTVGGNAPNNLITLCDKCHSKFHDGKIGLKNKRGKTFKAETYMSTVKKMMIDRLRELYNNVEETFGYLTKEKRLSFGLEKSHFNDAFCIANGENQSRCLVRNLSQKRKNNRCLQISRKKNGISIRKQRYLIQPKDLVRFEGKEYVSCGSQHYGEYVVVFINGKKKSIKTKNIEQTFHFGTFVFN